MNRYFASEKLPSMIKEKAAQLQVIESALRSPVLSRDEYLKLEIQVKDLNAKVNDLREQKLKLEQE